MAQAAPVDQSEGLPKPPFVNDDPFGLGGEAPQDPALIRSMAVPGGQPSGQEAEGGEWEPPSQDEWEEQEARTGRAEEAAVNAQGLVARSQELIAQAVTSQSAAPAVEEKPLGPPPSSSDDPEAFGKWMDERDSRFERKIVATMNQVQTNVAQMNTANDLFSNFIGLHPELKDTDNVRDLMIVAGKIKNVNANDPQEKIFKAVEAQFEAWGLMGQKPNGKDPAADRTGGVGTGSGRRRRRTAKPEEKAPMDLVDQMTEDQVRLGLA